MKNFDLASSIRLLERAPKMYRMLCEDLDPKWTHSREKEGSWSAYDIIGHLIHGEKTDWMIRAKQILTEEKPLFATFDRFAQFKASKGKNLDSLLDEFAQLRADNIQELLSWDLKQEDLQKKGMHPALGEVCLEELLATWTAHDLVHLNQLTRVMTKVYQQDVGPWKAYLTIMRD